MLTVFPCYAPADAAAAAELAAFLEAGGIRVFLPEGRIHGGQNLIAKLLEEAIQADVMLVLLSPACVPSPWPRRAVWEPAFRHSADTDGIRMACALLGRFDYPAALRRLPQFDLTGPPLEGFRAVKRWVMETAAAADPPFVPAAPAGAGRDAARERLAAALADRPGADLAFNLPLALDFAAHHAAEFDAVFYLPCAGRSTAELAGDLGAQLGMPLAGEIEANLLEIRRVLFNHRFLILMDDAGGDLLGLFDPGGLTSVLAVSHGYAAPPDDLGAEEQRALAAVAAGLDPGAHAAGLEERSLAVRVNARRPLYKRLCQSSADRQLAGQMAHLALHRGDLRAVQQAFRWALTQEDWVLTCELARRAVSMERRENRLAEAFEALTLLAEGAEARQDRAVMGECAWERAWILEHWGRNEEAAAMHSLRQAQYEDQMAFEF